MRNDLINIIRLSGQIIRETDLPPGSNIVRQGSLAKVKVQEDNLLLYHSKAGRQVGGEESLTGTLHQGQEQVTCRFLARNAREIEIASENTECLRKRIPSLVGHDDIAVILLVLGGNLTQHRDIGICLHILAETNFGVQQATKEEYQYREKQTDQDAQEHVLLRIRRNRDGVDASLVDNLGISYQGRLADEQFLTATQQVHIQLFLDTLDTGNIVNVELTGRDLTNLVRGNLAEGLHTADPLLDGTDVRHQQLTQIALERGHLQLHIPDNRVVRRTGLPVFVHLQDQLVELADRTLDMVVIDVHRHREQFVLRIGRDEFQKILGMGNLGIEPLHLFLALDALVQVGPAIIIQVQNLILALEARNLRFLGT